MSQSWNTIAFFLNNDEEFELQHISFLRCFNYNRSENNFMLLEYSLFDARRTTKKLYQRQWESGTFHMSYNKYYH